MAGRSGHPAATITAAQVGASAPDGRAHALVGTQSTRKQAATKRVETKAVQKRVAKKLRTLWRDNFVGQAGNAPDPRYWTPQIGGWGWGNEELQRYTADRANASLDGAGRLAITARVDRREPRSQEDNCWYGRCRYTSARLVTAEKITARYGKIEALIKVPKGGGLWPAFWMLGENFPVVGHPQSGEIDIMEVIGSEPGTVWGSVHGPGYLGLAGRYDLPAGQSLSDGFHLYTVDWSPAEIEFSVDGTNYHRVTRSDAGNNEWVFDQPFFIILNLAVGGRWPGEPGPDTPFPATMLVEYVGVYQ